MRIINFFTLFLITCSIFAQKDTLNKKFVKYTKKYEFQEGIYLNFEQFQFNEAIPKSRIVTDLDYNSYDFFENLFADEIIFIYDNLGVKKEIFIYNLWGFCHKGEIYIKHEDSFNKVQIIGNICHFIANKTVYNYDYYRHNSYYYDPHSVTNSSQEIKQYLIYLETGEVFEYYYKNLEIILMNDPILYDEYHNLSRRKRKKLKFVYIRKFNQNNPLYLPE